MRRKYSVLIIDDDISYLKDMKVLLNKDFLVKTTSHPDIGEEIILNEHVDTVLLDIDFSETTNGIEWLEKILGMKPNLPVIMVSYFDDPDIIVEALQKGAVDYIHKLSDINTFVSRIKNSINRFSYEIINNSNEIIANSRGMIKVLEEVESVVGTNTSVLLLGESGVGKTMLAKYIHQKSLRSNNNFVTLNVPSIPEALFESELFGHAKGAFTGAINNKIGKVEYADKGTLFIDEISEIPLPMQAKLLRFIEEKRYEKVGEVQSKEADVRIITASNRDLFNESATGNFRKDLFYRISQYIIEIPPLRKRKEDIIPLASLILQKKCQEYNKKKKIFSSAACDLLKEYDWPGNIRELINFIGRIVLKTNGKQELSENDVEANLNGDIQHQTKVERFVRYNEYKESEIGKIKYNYFSELLDRTEGNISKAASFAGITRQSLHKFLSEIGFSNVKDI